MVINGKVTQRNGLRGGVSITITGEAGETVVLSGLPKTECTLLTVGNTAEVVVTASEAVEQEPEGTEEAPE